MPPILKPVQTAVLSLNTFSEAFSDHRAITVIPEKNAVLFPVSSFDHYTIRLSRQRSVVSYDVKSG
jgi:hypothetical protein